ncbi:hypothetical protein D5E69_22690 (plasmid) [Rossellomorea marisflavi]|uniref:hypothetical protein n=1 Tax=Rossellomorea marisflavi TaxID=189381 RepID=UPI0013178FB0|nr:hypothetical protein [Rossellomorea marisflavi]QHA38652.1 hypothetical protein D5E69_22690 [Rossellomorea marisflavi]
MTNNDLKNLLVTAISLHTQILKNEKDTDRKKYYQGLIDGIEFSLKQIPDNK